MTQRSIMHVTESEYSIPTEPQPTERSPIKKDRQTDLIGSQREPNGVGYAHPVPVHCINDTQPEHHPGYQQL